MRCNIFNFTIQNVTECIDGVHTDTLIILQAVYQGLTEVVFLSFPHYRVKIESNKGSVFGTHIYEEEMD